jgi:Zn finger protein HypA/HybF involved in hydrogenase expression
MAKNSLKCASCNYKFNRTIAPELCPFCGKKSVVEDIHKGAEDLLREVEELEQSLSSRRPK